MMQSTDFLIAGGGIIALTLAKELIKKGVDKIIILEKEAQIAMHASGRNSGVLHAGIYYPPQTLKAQLCLKGNLLMQDYCKQHQLPLKQTGKVIVAKCVEELPTLLKLHERAQQNGATVSLIDESELNNIEPNAKTIQKALYSHLTAVVDSKMVIKTLFNELLNTHKVNILTNTAFIKPISPTIVKTNQGQIQFKQFINAGGAYADKIAHAFDIANQYYFLPFKGIYKKLRADKSYLINGSIYPVPDLRNPFLGVHFTKNIAGDVYVGPTAIPAFGRENYGFIKGIDREMLSILCAQFKMFFTNTQFRHLAINEPRKYFPHFFYQDAKALVKTLQPRWLVPSHKVGIRPQLINTTSNELVMDFVVIKEDNTLHILNAISPAFTSSMAFAHYIVSHYYT